MTSFYKIGFYFLLLIVALMVFATFKMHPTQINGGISWMDIYSNNSQATIAFLNKTLDIESKQLENTPEMIYSTIKAKKALFPSAGIMQITDEWRNQGLDPHSTLYFTVNDFEESSKKMLENGAKILVPVITKNKMKFGVFMIPGDIDIAIIQYNVKNI